MSQATVSGEYFNSNLFSNYYLDSEQADLVESFVPHAVDEAGGFAGFRETATKTISLIDRLEALTLPALDDVRGGLADYREAVERAAELDEQIERTDALIDEIVYELYGLTERRSRSWRRRWAAEH